MKTSVLAAALVLASCSAALAAPGGQGSSSSWDAATRNTNSKNYVTLFEQPNFGGRQFTFVGATNEVYRQGFKARSAKASGGPWTLCASGSLPQCQTVTGATSSIGFDVGSVEPGQGGQFNQGDRGDRGDQGGRGDRGDRGDRGGQGDFGRGDNPWSNSRDDRRGDIHRVNYSCRGGWMLTATFDERQGTVQIRTDREQPVVLNQVRSNSGFHYQGYRRAFYGRGDQATYETARGAVECRAD